MKIIKANWPQNEHQIEAFTTTRFGGVSSAPFNSFNLGLHVKDDPDAVMANRQALLKHCGLTKAQWLDQVHSVDCIKADGAAIVTADACWSDQAGIGCIVMTADCLPVAFRLGKKIAVAHAGWRGLLAGVLENTLLAMDSDTATRSQIEADRLNTEIWLGPAIGPRAFEVGEEVRALFVEDNPSAQTAFVASANKGKWLADIYQLAKLNLQACGILAANIHGAPHCTFTDQEHFYSYRKQPITGRMATIIYRKS